MCTIYKKVSNLTVLSLSMKYDIKVKIAQLHSTLYDPMNYTVRGILQARILEWVAISFSKESSQPRDRTQVSHIIFILHTHTHTHTHIYTKIYKHIHTYIHTNYIIRDYFK